MAITDLLDRIPISPGARRREAAGSGEPETPDQAFSLELPPVDRVESSVVTLPAPEPDPAAAPPASAPHRGRPGPVPLPSWAVAAIGGLALLCLAFAAALALSLLEPERVDSAVPPADTGTAEAVPDPAPVAPPPSPASYSAEPSPIPVDLLTRLEEASDETLDVELSRLLDAIQHGFGRRSAQLEPTLRSYVYRMGSRFEWNPDTFRVAVTAPDADLAAARAAVLERLFEDAAASGRLDVGHGVGPNALTLVTE